FPESSNSTNSQDHCANSLSSQQPNEEYNLVPNVSAQRQALNLIKEAESKKKKRRQLDKGIVVIYDTRECLFEFQKNLNLLDQIHECVEFGAAERRKRKSVIKTNSFDLSLALTLQFTSSMSSSFPAQIKISAISRSEIKPHIDEHYCLMSVKMAKEFATTFANHSLIIS
ncbi:41929_t:CDS:2, partial [Gigaspora margarita]